MRPLLFVWPYALVFWVVYIWAFAPEWRVVQQGFEGAKREGSQDSGSVRVIAAGMMMFIGIGLALGSWLSLGLLTITTIATYSYRVMVEERALLDTIGEPYRSYMKERKRFIPYIV